MATSEKHPLPHCGRGFLLGRINPLLFYQDFAAIDGVDALCGDFYSVTSEVIDDGFSFSSIHFCIFYPASFEGCDIPEVTPRLGRLIAFQSSLWNVQCTFPIYGLGELL